MLIEHFVSFQRFCKVDSSFAVIFRLRYESSALPMCVRDFWPHIYSRDDVISREYLELIPSRQVVGSWLHEEVSMEFQWCINKARYKECYVETLTYQILQ